MRAPDEDQPNRDLPAAVPYVETAQHFRVNVPRPNSTLLLGQRIPADGTAPAVGYPGVTLRTEAGCFVDVKQRSVWQGRESIVLQSEGNVELHGKVALLGTLKPTDKDDEPASGDQVRRTLRQDALYRQLRDQVIWMESLRLVRETIGIARSILTFPFALPAVGNVLGLIGGTATSALAAIQLKTYTPKQVEPLPGLYLSSHEGIFTAANGSQEHLATGGFSFIAGMPKELGKSPLPASISFFAPLTIAATAAVAIDLFGGGSAQLNSMGVAGVVSMGGTSIVAKLGTASVFGKNVEIGSLSHGPEVLRGRKINPLYLRRTQTVKVSARDEIVSTVGKRFVVNTPVGAVEVTSKKTVIESGEITLKTAACTVEVKPAKLTIAHQSGTKVTVDLAGVRVEAGPFSMRVVKGGFTAAGAGGSIKITPGGLVSIKSAVTKIG